MTGEEARPSSWWRTFCKLELNPGVLALMQCDAKHSGAHWRGLREMVLGAPAEAAGDAAARGRLRAARGGRRVALRLGRTASRVSSGAGDGPARAGDVVVGLEAVALTRSRESRRDAVTHIRVAIE